MSPAISQAMGSKTQFWTTVIESLHSRVGAASLNRVGYRAGLTSLSIALLSLLASAPAAAQAGGGDICQSNPGQFMGFGISVLLVVVVMAMLAGLLLVVILKSLQLNALANPLFGRVVVAGLILLGGVWYLNVVFGFVPNVSMDLACGI